MAVITAITNDWPAGVTLAADEVWQAQSGWIRISVEGSPDENDGIILKGERGDAVTIASGKTVKYKIASGVGPFQLNRAAF